MANSFFSTGSYTLTQGDDTAIDFNITDDQGNPVDISGYEFFFTSKSNPSLPDSSASIYKTITSFPSASLGLGSFPIYAADTTGSLPGKYFFDIRQKDTSGNITTLDSDTYYLVASITQNTNR